jgi:hypothetical protein
MRWTILWLLLLAMPSWALAGQPMTKQEIKAAIRQYVPSWKPSDQLISPDFLEVECTVGDYMKPTGNHWTPPSGSLVTLVELRDVMAAATDGSLATAPALFNPPFLYTFIYWGGERSYWAGYQEGFISMRAHTVEFMIIPLFHGPGGHLPVHIQRYHFPSKELEKMAPDAVFTPFGMMFSGMWALIVRDDLDGTPDPGAAGAPIKRHAVCFFKTVLPTQ